MAHWCRVRTIESYPLNGCPIWRWIQWLYSVKICESLRLCRCLNVGKIHHFWPHIFYLSNGSWFWWSSHQDRLQTLPPIAWSPPFRIVRRFLICSQFFRPKQVICRTSKSMVEIQWNSMALNLEFQAPSGKLVLPSHFWKSSIFDSAWIHEAPMCPKFVFCDGTIPSLLFKSAQPMQGYAGIKYKAWSSACIHVVFHPATASCRRHLWCISNFPLTRILTIGLQNVNGKQCWYCTQAIVLKTMKNPL